MAKASKTGLDALDFIVAAAELPRPPLYVLSGDQDFLKQRCRTTIVSKKPTLLYLVKPAPLVRGNSRWTGGLTYTHSELIRRIASASGVNHEAV